MPSAGSMESATSKSLVSAINESSSRNIFLSEFNRTSAFILESSSIIESLGELLVGYFNDKDELNSFNSKSIESNASRIVNMTLFFSSSVLPNCEACKLTFSNKFSKSS